MDIKDYHKMIRSYLKGEGLYELKELDRQVSIEEKIEADFPGAVSAAYKLISLSTDSRLFINLFHKVFYFQRFYDEVNGEDCLELVLYPGSLFTIPDHHEWKDGKWVAK